MASVTLVTVKVAATVIAECLSTVDDYLDRGNAVDLQLNCGEPLANQGEGAAVVDPYENLSAPDPLGVCEFTNMDGGSVVPGVYRDDGNGEIGIQENTVFAPGVYYSNGTSLRINAGTCRIRLKSIGTICSDRTAADA